MDELRLLVAGQDFGGWRAVAVRRSIEEVSGFFDVEVTDAFPGRLSGAQIRPGDPVEAVVGETPVVTGFVDEVGILVGPNGTTVRVQGRDATADLVDCSPDLAPGEWRRVTLERLARILAEPFQIPVEVLVDTGEPFAKVTMSPGETAWSVLEERASYRAVLAMSDGTGRLLLTEAGLRGEGEALVLGENLLSASLIKSHTARHSLYIVRGQSPGDDFLLGTAAAAPEGRAIDPTVRRNRPTIIVASSGVDAARCTKRARYEASVRAGRSERVAVAVQGWHQSTGDLWEPNLRVAVDADALGIHDELVISRVEYLRDEDSTTTRMSLMRKDAFAPLPEPAVEDSGLGLQLP